MCARGIRPILERTGPMDLGFGGEAGRSISTAKAGPTDLESPHRGIGHRR